MKYGYKSDWNHWILHWYCTALILLRSVKKMSLIKFCMFYKNEIKLKKLITTKIRFLRDIFVCADCKEPFYGENCALKCSKSCTNQRCHHVTGDCSLDKKVMTNILFLHFTSFLFNEYHSILSNKYMKTRVIWKTNLNIFIKFGVVEIDICML